MEKESMYRNAYFDVFSSKASERNRENHYNFNFGPSFQYDHSEEWKNTKSKYNIQGTNPVKILRRLEKELIQLTISNNDLLVQAKYQNDFSRSAIMDAIQYEGLTWQLITECVSADYIYFDHKGLDPIPEQMRTPKDLQADIVKGDHCILSCYYIIKWLEKIYSQEIIMPDEVLSDNVEFSKPKS